MTKPIWEATANGTLQPPPAEDGFAYQPITISQARVMISLCSEERQAEIRRAIVAAQAVLDASA
jgi:hypothetical protein